MPLIIDQNQDRAKSGRLAGREPWNEFGVSQVDRGRDRPLQTLLMTRYCKEVLGYGISRIISMDREKFKP